MTAPRRRKAFAHVWRPDGRCACCGMLQDWPGARSGCSVAALSGDAAASIVDLSPTGLELRRERARALVIERTARVAKVGRAAPAARESARARRAAQ